MDSSRQGQGAFGDPGEAVGRNQTPAGGAAVAKAAAELAAGLPVRQAPPVVESNGGAAQPPPTRRPPAADWPGDVEPAPLRHPLDVLSSLAHEQFNADFVHSTAVLFRIGGQVGTFLGVFCLIALGLALGSKTGQLAVAVPLAALGAAGLLISQFGALRLYPALERLDRTAWARISSTAPLDSLAWTLQRSPGGVVGPARFALASGALPGAPRRVRVRLLPVCGRSAWNARLASSQPAQQPRRGGGRNLSFLGKLAWRLSGVAHGAIVLGSLARSMRPHLGLAGGRSGWFGWETAVRSVSCCWRFAAARGRLPDVPRIPAGGGVVPTAAATGR